MAVSRFEQFLAEATVPDTDPARSLGFEELFGLYISWCTLHRLVPATEAGFRVAMKRHGIDAMATGLRMTGPAAKDYILESYPVLP
jgi:hypothetical protein